jgi:4-hydroxy-tetrahydrodipicolinate synthase
MNVSDLEGVVAILPTPLTDEGDIDKAGVRHLVEFSADKGLHGVVILGSNSEFPYLSFEEKVQVMKVAGNAGRGKIPVIAGASAWSTDEAVALANEAGAAGCNAVMVTLPKYFDMDFKLVVKHFETVAGKGGLPVYFYYFPDVTGLELKPNQFAEIAAIDGIVGAKMTVINRSYLKKSIQATRPHGWKVFTGMALLLKDCLEFGGAGLFCPLSLIGHEDVKGIYNSYKAGDMAKCKKLQAKVRMALPLISGIDMPPRLLATGFQLLSRLPAGISRPGGNQGLIKEALRLQGHPITNRVKRPYEEVTESQAEMVKRILDLLGWL